MSLNVFDGEVYCRMKHPVGSEFGMCGCKSPRQCEFRETNDVAL